MTPEQEDKVVALVSDGIGVYRCCKEDISLPTNGAITDWMARFPEFAAKIAHARTISSHKSFDEIVEIADEYPPVVEGRVDTGWVQWQKNRMYAREKRAAKLNPKHYGDKLDLTSKGDKVQTTPLMVVCSNPETASILERMAHGEQPATSPSQDQ